VDTDAVAPQDPQLCTGAAAGCVKAKPSPAEGGGEVDQPKPSGWQAAGLLAVGMGEISGGALGEAVGAGADSTVLFAAGGVALGAVSYFAIKDGADKFGDGLDGLFGNHTKSATIGPAQSGPTPADSGMTAYADRRKEEQGIEVGEAAKTEEPELSRREAFRKTKRDLGIPLSQQPDSIDRAPLTDRDGRWILDENKQKIPTREYQYSRPGRDPEEVVIQEHSRGHQFGEDGVGDQGPHFNARPRADVRGGKVDGTKEHYPFGK
jgi:hypothetical protein